MTANKKPLTPTERLQAGLNKAAEEYEGRWAKPDTWTKAVTTLGKGYEEAAKRDGYHKDPNSRAAKKSKGKP